MIVECRNLHRAALLGLALFMNLLAELTPAADAKNEPVAIADVTHEEPVDFETEVLPILKKNCIACHNHASKKGELILETPQTIAKGGASGPVVDQDAADESMLLQVASRQSEPVMPPADNKVAALPLTPAELGLLRLWIREGAKGEVKDRASALAWQPLPPGVNPIYSVAVTPDGQFAACGRANQIYIYHLPSGKLHCQLTDPALLDGKMYKNPGVAHHDLVHSLAFSADGYTLASGDYRVVKLWQRPRDVRRMEFAAGQPVTAIASTTDGKFIATAGADYQIRIWNSVDGKPVAALTGHAGRITALRFSSDQSRLYSASEDSTIRAWDVVAAKPIARIDGPSALEGLALSPDGTQLVTAGADGMIRSWAIPGPAAAPLATLPAEIQSVATSADRQQLAVIVADGAALLVEAATGKLQRQLRPENVPFEVVSFSPDGKQLALGAADGQVKVWLFSAADAPLVVGNGPATVTAIAWHPGGKEMLAASADGKLTAWGLEGAVAGSVPLKVLRQFTVSSAAIRAMLYSHDGATAFVAGEEGKVVAHSASDGSPKFAAMHGAPIQSLAMSADGKLLASAGRDQLIKLWNTADGTPAKPAILQGLGGEPTALAFSADGKMLVAGTANNRAALFNTANGSLVQVFAEHTGSVSGVAFDVAGTNQVMTASADKTIRSWPILALKQMAGHSARATCVEALAGAAHVLSGSDDGTVRQWDLTGGTEVRKFDAGAAVTAIAVRGDAQRLAAATASNLVRLWQTSDGKQLAEIKGDFKIQQLVAALSSKQAVAKQNGDVAKAALAAAEKERADRLAAITPATEQQQKMIAALAEAETKSKAATEAKAKVDQLAAESAAKAKAAADAKAASEKLAADLAQVVNLVNDAAAKAKTAAEAGATATTATVALAAVTKEAAGKFADQTMADANAAAQKLAADSTSLDEAIKSLRSSLAKIVEEKVAAAKAAADKKTVNEKLLAEANAAAKAANDAKAAAEKSAKEAADALTAAMNNKQSADKGLADAQRSAKVAEELLPERKSAFDEATAILAALDKQVASANAELPKHEQPIRALAFSPDGQLLAAAGDDPVIHAYRADDGTPFETLAGHQGRIAALGFAPNGNLLSASDDGTARLWDLYPLWTYAGQLGPSSDSPQALSTSVFVDRVLALAFSDDGRLLATGGGEPSRSGELTIWDVAEKKLLVNLPEAHSDTIFGVDFSPTGKFLASCGADKFIRVFEVASGKQVRTFEGHTHHVLGVRWQADGKSLASCGADNVVKVWNFETGEQQRTIGGFNKEVTSISYLGTTPMTVATSGDKTVRLHNTADGQNPRNFAGATDFMYTARVTADGRLIVAGGADSVLRVWSAGDGKQLLELPAPK